MAIITIAVKYNQPMLIRFGILSLLGVTALVQCL